MLWQVCAWFIRILYLQYGINRQISNIFLLNPVHPLPHVFFPPIWIPSTSKASSSKALTSFSKQSSSSMPSNVTEDRAETSELIDTVRLDIQFSSSFDPLPSEGGRSSPPRLRSSTRLLKKKAKNELSMWNRKDRKIIVCDKKPKMIDLLQK